MKKLLIVAVAALAFVGVSGAQVLSGDFNSGRDEETENTSTMDIRLHACDYDSSLTCGTAIRSVNADGSTNEGVMLEPSKNFDPNSGEPFEMAGALILTGLMYAGKKDGHDRWEGGLFYNPVTYKEFDGVYVQMRADGDIDVGGCVLIFCQDTTFNKL